MLLKNIVIIIYINKVIIYMNIRCFLFSEFLFDIVLGVVRFFEVLGDSL